jgi:hypothetical protein
MSRGKRGAVGAASGALQMKVVKSVLPSTTTVPPPVKRRMPGARAL